MRSSHAAWSAFTALTLVAAPGECRAQPGEDPIPVPAGAKVSLVLDKDEYLLGENILIHLVIENTGTAAFAVNEGGDYRNSLGRPLRYHVEVWDEKGNEVPDTFAVPLANPLFTTFGGISAWGTVKPGGKYYITQPLMRFRRFEKAGTYKLRVRHDLGWKDAPAAEGTIKVVMPTPDQARKVVDAMYALPRRPSHTMGYKRDPFAEFLALAYPVYLPILAERVAVKPAAAIFGAVTPVDAAVRLAIHYEQMDCALEGIAYIPDPAAKAALYPLRDSDDKLLGFMARLWYSKWSYLH